MVSESSCRPIESHAGICRTMLRMTAARDRHAWAPAHTHVNAHAVGALVTCKQAGMGIGTGGTATAAAAAAVPPPRRSRVALALALAYATSRQRSGLGSSPWARRLRRPCATGVPRAARRPGVSPAGCCTGAGAGPRIFPASAAPLRRCVCCWVVAGVGSEYSGKVGHGRVRIYTRGTELSLAKEPAQLADG